MSVVLVTPAPSPVTLADAKAHARVDHDDDDALIGALISAAVSHAQMWCSRVFGPSVWELSLPAFPNGGISLPFWPIVSVQSVAYEDTLGLPQTVSGHSLSNASVLTGSWPAGASNVVVRFTAGEGFPDDVRHAILLLIGHWYANRESVSEGSMLEVPLASTALLDLHRRLFV